jgi:hypothetical protein
VSIQKGSEMETNTSQSTCMTIPPFDVTLLHQDTLLMVVGNPGSGKTNTVKSLLVELAHDAAVSHRQDFPLLHVAMYGSKGEGEYDGIIHPTLVHDDVQADSLRDVVNRALRIRQDASTAPAETDREDMSTRIILDDVTSSRQIFENKYARFIWRKNRHVGLSVWLCSQYVNDAPSWMRQLFSVVMILRVNNSDRRELFKNYGHLFRDHHTFSHVLSETTKVPGRSLVLYLRAPPNNAKGCAGNAPAAVSYYDWLDPDTVAKAGKGMRLLHPDIRAELDTRGDPAKYDKMEEI